MSKDQFNQDGKSAPGSAATEETPALTKEDIEKLLGKRVAETEVRNLTAAGENYGSQMLSVDVVLESGEKLSLVAKMFPRNEYAQKMFQSPLSMRKEIDMYQAVSPELDKIQEEACIPPSERLRVLCACPGARLSLQDKENVQLADKDSVLLLENLMAQGYTTVDRTSGLDLRHTEFALKHLARFHATAVAIKLKKPQVFKDTVLRACTPFKFISKTREEMEESHRIFLEKLRKIPACERHIDSIQKLFEKDREYNYSDYYSTPQEPFATILHKDFWSNNMMFKYSDETGDEPIDFKIVDFQTTMYESPVSDIMLLLFTSTQAGILEDKFDHLLRFYHECFSEWLEKLGCEIKDFSFDSFLNEVSMKATDSLRLTMTLLRPITLTKEEAKQFTGGPNFDKLDFNENYARRVSTVVDIYAQKGWLQ